MFRRIWTTQVIENALASAQDMCTQGAQHLGGNLRIQSVEIVNFRCIQNQTIELDNITSIIGPNGAGKSTVLRALDWVFNGAKESLTNADAFGIPDPVVDPIRVTVTFADLTDRDKDVLTERYAPSAATTFALRREWHPTTGDRLSGGSEAYPGFAPVRAVLDGPASTVKEKYESLRETLSQDGVVIPEAKTKPAIVAALDTWEREHQEQLKPTFTSDNQLFGFAGQGEVSKIFAYVFVDADLRAHDESEDTSKTIVGRLLARALDRTGADTALAGLAADIEDRHNTINEEHLGPRLKEISERLTASIGRFTAGRTMRLQPQKSSYTPPKARVDVRVFDEVVETSLGHQGHGFQRSALIASLQVLADLANETTQDNTLFLAIEEPELFQHPNQARAFASVLRRLASDDERKLQVAYATHSLYFVEPSEFHEVRRITRDGEGRLKVAATDRLTIASRVAPYMSSTWDINSGWSKLILQDLREALFASAVVLCEGADDAAILEGASRHIGDFDVNGITATAVKGKTDLFLAKTVLDAFSIPTLMVWDNDSGAATRAAEKKLDKLAKAGTPRILTQLEMDDCEKIKKDTAEAFNKKVQAFESIHPEVAYPLGEVTPNLFAVNDTLETMLSADWPDQFEARASVMAEGNGHENPKHEATYRLAARKSEVAPSGQVKEILHLALALTS